MNPAASAPTAAPLGPRSTAVRAGALSVVVGIAILGAKFAAYLITGSAVLLADAAESIVNVIAAAMVTYSVAVAARPADRDHPYGHGKAEPLSAAIEGAMIVAAATVIVFASVRHLAAGTELRELGTGIVISAIAGLGNLGLGLYLLRVGRRESSEAIQADGIHVLTDVATTAGALLALTAVHYTGIHILDPIVALLVAANILRTGWRVVRRALVGLLDEADFELLSELARHLESKRSPEWIEIHELRERRSGAQHHVDLHLTVPRYQSMEQAHLISDRLERSLLQMIGGQGGVVVHLDPCQPRHCSGCSMENCPVRSAPRTERLEFNLGSVTKRGEI